MSSKTAQLQVLTVFAAFMVTLMATPVLAQSPAFNDFSGSPANLARNGNAQFAGTALRLTPAMTNQTGSAWFNVRQPVQNGFTTTFQFRITSPSESTPADGLAFVIQNSTAGLSAIGFTGGNGGPIGYGDRDASTNPSTGEGIANSLAIEFDTYKNGWDLDANHIAVQSCGAGNNTSHHNRLCQGESGSNSTLGRVFIDSPLFSNAATHTAIITYTPPSDSATGSIQVSVDGVDRFDGGVPVDLGTLLTLNDGTAFVGFTGSTGASVENNDILSWTFQPQVSQDEETIYQFQDDSYTYGAQLNSGTPVTAVVTPILMTQAQCNALVQANPFFVAPPLTTQCFVYKNADGAGNDASVLFELTCPGLSGSPNCNPFDAELSSNFDLPTNPAANPGFNTLSGGPFPGWLKGHGGNFAHPCTSPSAGFPLFQSNQIDFFSFTRTDPKTKGGSGGTGSCWVATYNTPHEEPTIDITAPAAGGNYTQGSAVNANYECHAVNNSPNSTGPYLTVESCNGTVADGQPFDTSTAGPHTFSVTVTDSATDTATKTVNYNVVGPNADLAILKLGPLKAPTNKKLTYTIGGTNFGSNSASGVVVTDPLPSGETFVSASGKNKSCSIVHRNLVCTTTSVPCTYDTPTRTVTCAVGSLAPLSWSSLNGTVLQLTVNVTAPANSTIKNKASISSFNADPKSGNNSSTATTAITR